jgi:myo-inositol-1-phosphate synthase
VIIDALRCCKVAQDCGIAGPLLGLSSYFMKSPPIQHRDEEARELVDEFAR